MDELKTSGLDLTYADSVLEALRAVIKGHGRCLSGVVFINIRRGRFATVEQFVKEFKNLVKESNQLGCPITPYCASTILLSQLEQEFRPWVEAVRSSWSETIEKDMTESHFLKICNQAVESLSYQSNEQFAATSFKKQPQYANRPNQRREWKPFKNSPGNDADIDAHVKILRKLPSTTNGGCGYCKEKGHLAPKCNYLADELPEGWKPDPEKHLWCYFFLKRYKEKRAKQNSQPTLQAKEELTPPSNLAISEDRVIEFHFSPFQGLALPLDELDCEESNIKESATEKVDPEETDFYNSNIVVIDDKDTVTDNIDTMSDEEFIGREPDFVGATVEFSAIGKWISDTGSANNIVGNLDDFIEYHSFKQDQMGYRFGCSNGTSGQAKGYGTALMRLDLMKMTIQTFSCHRTTCPRYVTIYSPVRRQNTIRESAFRSASNPSTSTARTHRIRQKHGDKSHGAAPHCDPCRLAKSKRLVSLTSGGNLLHRRPDDQTCRLVWIEAEASQACVEFCKKIKVTTGRYPSRDGGNEYNAFKQWTKPKDIKTNISPPQTPKPNGIPERAQGYVVQTARTMMIDAGLPAHLWPFAIDTAIYIINRLVKEGFEKSPLQLWRDELRLANDVPSLSHLKVWGAKAYIHIPSEDRVKSLKMLPRAKIGRLVGYEGDHGHVYKIWMPETGEIKRSRDVS
ncbi:hypothetical protein Egran_03413 [Elaphomyces granulatus]|uniref:Integrase catalytic domain-containing protein n=1 Tax=Elaphomyces granulatus TaxID=519963 RepID=A0A232LXM2_9EURO|nr:hypothetical protein Egran_03413 [Elaphomyces granulatus]